MKVSSGTLLLGALLIVLTLAGFAFRKIVEYSHTAPRGARLLTPGTFAMTQRLDKLRSAQDPETNPFLNARRAERLSAQLAAAGRRETTTAAEVDLQLQLGIELLRAGNSRAALDQFTKTAPLAATLNQTELAYTWYLRRLRGLASLRLAEQENCVAQHNAESCLFPIRGGGVHAAPEGSQNAAEFFLECLRENPRDDVARWLLNLAHMTLGSFPDGVPEEHRLPQSSVTTTDNAPRFRDVAEQAGVAALGLSGGVAVDDFTGDGLLDIFCSSWGLADAPKFFVNGGDGSFAERSMQAHLDVITGGLNVCHADYDNDGWLDILVLRGAWLGESGRQPNSLLRNLRGRKFEDVTEATGLLSLHPTQTAAWGDFDNDGWLDLFIGNESVKEDGVTHPCELYRNNADGTFTECAAAYGVAHVGYVKGVAWGDYDRDGFLDLFLSCLDEPNVLFRNAGPSKKAPSSGAAEKSHLPAWSFENVSRQAGVEEPRLSFPCWFWDYDQDGWLDLLVLSYAWDEPVAAVAAEAFGRPTPGPHPVLYQNRGDGTFMDVTKEAGWAQVVIAMGCNFGDIDNDGFPDAYVGTGEPSLNSLMPNRLFRNTGGDEFVDATISTGLGHLQKGHGIAFADFDQDGDQDIYAVLGGAYEGDAYRNALFENPGTDGNHWLTLRLEGRRSNRSAIGATVVVELQEGNRQRRVYATVSTGGSFGSQSLEQELGLGRADDITAVRVRWPATGEVQSVEGVPMDAAILVVEGKAGFIRLERTPFRLGATDAKDATTESE